MISEAQIVHHPVCIVGRGVIELWFDRTEETGRHRRRNARKVQRKGSTRTSRDQQLFTTYCRDKIEIDHKSHILRYFEQHPPFLQTCVSRQPGVVVWAAPEQQKAWRSSVSPFCSRFCLPKPFNKLTSYPSFGVSGSHIHATYTCSVQAWHRPGTLLFAVKLLHQPGAPGGGMAELRSAKAR